MLAWIAQLGWVELALIGLVALLFFGKRLPGAARALGRAAVEFRRGLKGERTELEEGEHA